MSHQNINHAVQKLFWVWTNFWSQRNWLAPKILLIQSSIMQKNDNQNNSFSRATNFWSTKNFQFKYFLGPKSFSQKEFWSKACKKLGPKSFGKNWISYSWDILDKDKCCQNICSLGKCQHDNLPPVVLCIGEVIFVQIVAAYMLSASFIGHWDLNLIFVPYDPCKNSTEALWTLQ